MAISSSFGARFCNISCEKKYLIKGKEKLKEIKKKALFTQAIPNGIFKRKNNNPKDWGTYEAYSIIKT